jgi:hypothetical protein
MTLLEMAIEKYGSVAKMAEAMETARSPLSSALHGHTARSRVYWARRAVRPGCLAITSVPYRHLGDAGRVTF